MDEAFLTQLVNCLPMGAMVVNTDAQILFANNQLKYWAMRIQNS